MNDLKQCPACHQKEAHVIERLKESMILLPAIAFVAQCQACEFCGPERDRPCDAAAAWNRRASPWQPIETAPTDGTLIMLWFEKWGYIDIGSFDYVDGWARANDGAIYTSVWVNIGDPTHWMPLPEPPEAE